MWGGWPARPDAWHSPSRGWPSGCAIVICLGFVTHTLGQGLTSLAIGRTPVGVVALVLLARPPVSALFSWGVLGEAMTGLQMVGGAIILIAVPMSQSG